MAEFESQKSPEVIALLEALRARLGGNTFAVVDHWPEDPEAIGVASPSDHGVLAYISVSSGGDEPYFVSLETPPSGEWSDHPYTPGDERGCCDLDQLVQIVARHIRVGAPRAVH